MGTSSVVAAPSEKFAVHASELGGGSMVVLMASWQ